MYTSNVDTYGKNAKRLDELVAEIEDAGRGGTRKGFFQAPGEKMLSWVNPERHRRWMHASVRLWMYNATGQEFLLQPGFRSLAAADNTASSVDTRAALMFHKDAIVLAEQQSVRSQTQYKQEYLSTLYTADCLYGVQVYRPEAGFVLAIAE